MIAALRTLAPGVGASAHALLQGPQPRPFPTVLNDLGTIAGDLVLVLDTYHVVDACAVQDGMAFLLDHLPSQLHLMIASRGAASRRSTQTVADRQPLSWFQSLLCTVSRRFEHDRAPPVVQQ